MQYQLKDLELMVRLGVYESEQGGPQPIKLNVWFEFEAQKAAESDQLEDTLDYAAIEQAVRLICDAKHYQLLEHLHGQLIQQLQQRFPQAQNWWLSIEKYPFENGSVVLAS